MPTMIRSMTDADNKMSVNLHENGKQQESQSVARSSIINSFVAASGTLIIILCSRLDTCSRVLCVSPRSPALLVSRCSLPDFSPALSCPQFSNRTFYNFLRCLYKVVTCPYSQHLASHANFSSIIVLLKKNDKSWKVRKHAPRRHKIHYKLILSISILYRSWHYFTTLNFYFSQSESYLLSYSALHSGEVSCVAILQEFSSQIATPGSNLRSSREAITVRGYSPLRSPRLARNARKVRCPGFELGKIGGQLVLSELRLVSRYYETPGSESTVAAWSAENNLTRGRKCQWGPAICILYSMENAVFINIGPPLYGESGLELYSLCGN